MIVVSICNGVWFFYCEYWRQLHNFIWQPLWQINLWNGQGTEQFGLMADLSIDTLTSFIHNHLSFLTKWIQWRHDLTLSVIKFLQICTLLMGMLWMDAYDTTCMTLLCRCGGHNWAYSIVITLVLKEMFDKVCSYAFYIGF